MINKNKIIIPKEITLLYSPKKNLLTVIGPQRNKSMKLNFKIIVDPRNRSLIVTRIYTGRFSNNLTKRILGFQGRTVSLIKSKILETKFSFYIRLKLVGVGYRALLDGPESIANHFILKLGYSHFIYYKLPQNLRMYCYKYTKLTLYGSCSFNFLTQTSAKIRSQRAPEPYKGKGVLYANECVSIKIGKRV